MQTSRLPWFDILWFFILWLDILICLIYSIASTFNSSIHIWWSLMICRLNFCLRQILSHACWIFLVTASNYSSSNCICHELHMYFWCHFDKLNFPNYHKLGTPRHARMEPSCGFSRVILFGPLKTCVSACLGWLRALIFLLSKLTRLKSTGEHWTVGQQRCCWHV